VGLPVADIAKNTEVARCQNLHRTFDHSLVGVDQDYCILISKPIRKLGEHTYSLQKLKGTKLVLPKIEQYHLAQDNLAWHRRKADKKG